MNLKALELSAMEREKVESRKWFVKIISLQFISFSRPKKKSLSKAFDKIVAEKKSSMALSSIQNHYKSIIQLNSKQFSYA